jgi:hypothetical protein
MAFIKLPSFLRAKTARLQEAEETIRQKTLSVLSREVLNFTCTSSDIKGLNLVELERISHELTGLGFEFCEDRRTRWQGASLDAGFYRMFVNVAESCFASVGGTTKGFQRGERLAVGFDAPLKEGGGWVGGANLKLFPIRLYIRCPRCALLLMPSSDASRLFGRFLSLKQTIVSKFGIKPPQNLTLEMLDRVRSEHLTERIAAIRERTYFHEASEAAKSANDVEWIWRGEYS